MTKPLTHADVYSLFDLLSDDRRVMTRQESEMYVTCVVMERRRPQALTTAELEVALLANNEGKPLPFAMQVFIKRLALAGPDMVFSPEVVLFVTALCANPAQVVMWAYSIVRETRKIGGVVTTTTLADRFPDGFPTDRGYSTVWDKQKLRGEHRGPGMNDNWFDTPEAWVA